METTTQTSKTRKATTKLSKVSNSPETVDHNIRKGLKLNASKKTVAKRLEEKLDELETLKAAYKDYTNKQLQ